jgi:hypothetical protein
MEGDKVRMTFRDQYAGHAVKDCRYWSVPRTVANAGPQC